MLLLTLRGTPTIYYGDEVGLPQVPIPSDRIRDPFERNVPGIGVGRDGARTPMQWSTEKYSGFSTLEPWLPLSADWPMRNVQVLAHDESSIYGLYRRLIQTRRLSKALRRGSYHPIAADGDLLLYVRAFGSERILMALNLGSEPATVSAGATECTGRILVSTSGEYEGKATDSCIRLDANEGFVIELATNASLPLGDYRPDGRLTA
jgi:alpha-glucosidase